MLVVALRRPVTSVSDRREHERAERRQRHLDRVRVAVERRRRRASTPSIAPWPLPPHCWSSLDSSISYQPSLGHADAIALARHRREVEHDDGVRPSPARRTYEITEFSLSATSIQLKPPSSRSSRQNAGSSLVQRRESRHEAHERRALGLVARDASRGSCRDSTPPTARARCP